MKRCSWYILRSRASKGPPQLSRLLSQSRGPILTWFSYLHTSRHSVPSKQFLYKSHYLKVGLEDARDARLPTNRNDLFNQNSVDVQFSLSISMKNKFYLCIKSFVIGSMSNQIEAQLLIATGYTGATQHWVSA